MRKAILVLALLATAVVAGSAGARSSANFTYCTDPTFPPLEYVAGGKITGFDVDMASALAKTFGATAKPLKTAFPGASVDTIVSTVRRIQRNAATLGIIGGVLLAWTSISLFTQSPVPPLGVSVTTSLALPTK